MCFRTLDLYTAATLEHSLKPPPSPAPEWRALMDRMSKVSCAAYRAIVFNEPKARFCFLSLVLQVVFVLTLCSPQFIKYFHAATPSSELGRMNIGSRPAKRKPNAGIESLRAIPWIFAWTQTRFHLPVWLGIGSALSDAAQAGMLPTLQARTRRAHPLGVSRSLTRRRAGHVPGVALLLRHRRQCVAQPLSSLIFHVLSLILVATPVVEMVLAKADPRVMTMYEKELVHDAELIEFGAKLRELYAETEEGLLAVTGHSALLEGPAPPTGAAPLSELKRKLDLRTPYITPLNSCEPPCSLALRLGLFSFDHDNADTRAPPSSHLLRSAVLQAQYLRKQRAAAEPGAAADQWAPSLPWAKELLHRGAGGSYNGVDDVILITVKGAIQQQQRAPLTFIWFRHLTLYTRRAGISAGMQNTG